jgi:hypothetical protein
MTFDTVDYDIPYQPGVNAYDFIASGTIYKGQAVMIAPGMNEYVIATPNSSQRVVGVAAYTQYHNSSIAVYGKLNMVHAKLSGAQSAGANVGGYDDGMFHDSAKYKCAVVVDGTASTGDGVVLLY